MRTADKRQDAELTHSPTPAAFVNLPFPTSAGHNSQGRTVSLSIVTDHPTILVVGEGAELADSCAEALSKSGQRVQVVGNVYAAMAILARCPELRRVLIDVRPLDRAEAAFLSLAPRYFPSVDFAVALVEGAAERLQSLGITCKCVTPQAFVDPSDAVTLAASRSEWQAPEDAPPPEPLDDDQEILSAIEAPPEPWPEGVPPSQAPSPTSPRPPLSTDGGPESALEGLSLHDAVRARMLGHAGAVDATNDPRKFRRKPPSGPSRDAPPAPRTDISAEELSALLAPDSPSANLQTPETDQEAEGQ